MILMVRINVRLVIIVKFVVYIIVKFAKIKINAYNVNKI